jgi:hypothetical protein
MGALQEIFRTHGPRYIERFGAAMPYAPGVVKTVVA